MRGLLDSCSQIAAIGINCTPIEHIPPLIEEIKRAASKPIIAYPNSGEQYDPVTKTWKGAACENHFGKSAQSWYENGVSLIGGCCRTKPEDIQAIADCSQDLKNNLTNRNSLYILFKKPVRRNLVPFAGMRFFIRTTAESWKTMNNKNETNFQRSMKSRHLFMLSLGGVIGTGLFLSSGYTIHQAVSGGHHFRLPFGRGHRLSCHALPR